MLMLKKKVTLTIKMWTLSITITTKFIYLLSYEKITVRSTGQKLVYIKSIS